MSLTPMRHAAVLAAVTVLSVAALLTGSRSARAQFSPLSLPSATADAGSGGTGGEVPSARKNITYSLGFFPLAPFEVGYHFNYKGSVSNAGTITPISGSSGARKTISGLLFAPEVTFTSKTGKGGIAFGGWYWAALSNHNDYSDVGDIHIKYLVTPKLGAEVGYLFNPRHASNDVKQEGVNLIASYAVVSQPRRNKKPGISVVLGAGVQEINNSKISNTDTSNGLTQTIQFNFKSTTDFTGYLAGGFEVTKNLSVNLSYWYLGGSQKVNISDNISAAGAAANFDTATLSRDSNRVALGASYSF